eukprot:2887866-Rhodomonas_salina.3
MACDVLVSSVLSRDEFGADPVVLRKGSGASCTRTGTSLKMRYWRSAPSAYSEWECAMCMRFRDRVSAPTTNRS